jgi:hypothetical protein
MRADALPARVLAGIANDFDVLVRRLAIDRLENIGALRKRLRECAQQFDRDPCHSALPAKQGRTQFG